jgi:hypothetical protein
MTTVQEKKEERKKKERRKNLAFFPRRSNPIAFQFEL